MDTQAQEPIPEPNPPATPVSSSPTPSESAPVSVPPSLAEPTHRHARHSYPWIGGAILILLGVVFLLQNLNIPFLTNWWALFILIPAFWSYVAAWDSFQDNNRLTRRGAGSLTWGIILTVLALVFLLGLNIGLFWPVLLIVGGLALVGTATLRD